MSEQLLKAAVVLTELPNDEAALLLKQVGPELAKRIDDRGDLAMAVSSEHRETYLREFISATQQPSQPLHEIAPDLLVGLLKPEHPQVIACILSRQSASRTHRVLSALPVELRLDVTDRMRSLGPIDIEIQTELEDTIAAKVCRSKELAA